MFNIDKNFTHVGQQREDLIILVQSINAVSVKIPGYPNSPAIGYIAAWKVGGVNASIIIYFHFKEACQCSVYCHEPKIFPLNQLEDVKQESLEFLESMGFMADDTNFSSLSPKEKQSLFECTPLFFSDLKDFNLATEDDELPEADIIEMVSDVDEVQTPENVPSAAPSQPNREDAARVERIARLLISF